MAASGPESTASRRPATPVAGDDSGLFHSLVISNPERTLGSYGWRRLLDRWRGGAPEPTRAPPRPVAAAPLRLRETPAGMDDELFTGLVVSNPPKLRRGRVWTASLATHVVALLAVVLIPILWPEQMPETPDYIRALIYNPPPPPPLPLPKGSELAARTERPKPVADEPKPQATPEPTPEPKLVAEIEAPREEPLQAQATEVAENQWGSPTGSEFGVPEGMEGGVEGGQVGGVPGGVIGGVVGGTGDIPVMDYDRPPRPIRMTKPQYPQEAFVKKIEGVVVVEILIDKTGRVVRARVVQSIPALDAAAIATVKQWLFEPAIKGGRPVATIANAPVGFRIF